MDEAPRASHCIGIELPDRLISPSKLPCKVSRAVVSISQTRKLRFREAHDWPGTPGWGSRSSAPATRLALSPQVRAGDPPCRSPPFPGRLQQEEPGASENLLGEGGTAGSPSGLRFLMPQPWRQEGSAPIRSEIWKIPEDPLSPSLLAETPTPYWPRWGSRGLETWVPPLQWGLREAEGSLLNSFRGCAGGFWGWREKTSCLQPTRKDPREYPVARAQPGAMRGDAPKGHLSHHLTLRPLRLNLTPLLPATAWPQGARAFPHGFLHSLCPSTSHPHGPDEKTALLTVLLLATAHTPHPGPSFPSRGAERSLHSSPPAPPFPVPSISPGKV